MQQVESTLEYARQKLEEIYDEIDKLEKTEIENLNIIITKKIPPISIACACFTCTRIFASSYPFKKFYIVMFQLEERIWFWLLFVFLNVPPIYLDTTLKEQT